MSGDRIRDTTSDAWRRSSRRALVGSVGLIGEVGLEIVAPAIDEVIADVRRAIGRRAVRRCLAGALDRFQRDADLRFAGRRGELFDARRC